jgi:superfamily I DNA/RNA helicase
MVLRD